METGVAKANKTNGNFPLSLREKIVFRIASLCCRISEVCIAVVVGVTVSLVSIVLLPAFVLFLLASFPAMVGAWLDESCKPKWLRMRNQSLLQKIRRQDSDSFAD